MFHELAYDKRTNISKKLKSRAEAIKNAVKRYNRQAALLDPPRDPVDINQILEYSFISEFDLLRLSREDIREKPWVQTGNREAMARHFRIKAAHDEIKRLNVEIRRLVTSIADEQKDMIDMIKLITQTDQPLATEIERRWSLRQAFSEDHINQVFKLATKDGFSGSIVPGTRLGRMNEGDRSLPEVQANENVHDLAGELSEDDDVLEIATTVENWGTGL
jgi:hypothetical protein